MIIRENNSDDSTNDVASDEQDMLSDKIVTSNLTLQGLHELVLPTGFPTESESNLETCAVDAALQEMWRSNCTCRVTQSGPQS